MSADELSLYLGLLPAPAPAAAAAAAGRSSAVRSSVDVDRPLALTDSFNLVLHLPSCFVDITPAGQSSAHSTLPVPRGHAGPDAVRRRARSGPRRIRREKKTVRRSLSRRHVEEEKSGMATSVGAAGQLADTPTRRMVDSPKFRVTQTHLSRQTC